MKTIQRSLLFFLFAVLLAVLSITSTASAETETPTIGCNSSGCSIWLLEYAWPDKIGINALEFFRVNIDVNKTNTALSGSVNYFGVLCLIPKVSDLPICPRDLGAASTVPAPGPWSPEALASY